ncbi:IniB N-terminal domain-containing protein [Microbacterium abyssi]|uniref:IniB N-terminal domain-containing protein n=1 Tax=Microbacterium abyssi TaxID=2782166 RepID=UPI001886FBBC|nr:IniB N-terminal domain-containing protein [Microbacterium sp. A18JL241]
MTSPVETIADALIAFILSLLRDPDAAAGFAADPDTALEDNNLRSACMADVAAVRPVIVDRPDVVTRTQVDPPPPPSTPTEVTNEIMRMVQQFTTIDARSTMVDQSVNQNIWTAGGDVTQLFDQEAIIASGDGSVAAGDDGTIENGDTDVTVGDVSVGNDTYDGSFNGTDVDVTTPSPAAPADPAEAATPVPAAPVTTTEPAAPVDVPEPADVLDTDMAAADDSYDADAASAAVADEALAEEPVEEE